MFPSGDKDIFQRWKISIKQRIASEIFWVHMNPVRASVHKRLSACLYITRTFTCWAYLAINSSLTYCGQFQVTATISALLTRTMHYTCSTAQSLLNDCLWCFSYLIKLVNPPTYFEGQKYTPYFRDLLHHTMYPYFSKDMIHNNVMTWKSTLANGPQMFRYCEIEEAFEQTFATALRRMTPTWRGFSGDSSTGIYLTTYICILRDQW